MGVLAGSLEQLHTRVTNLYYSRVAPSEIRPHCSLNPGAVRALALELSGTAARHTVQDLTLHHRMRGSRGFKAAADHIAERARSYGLAVEVISLPADGKVFYGTQRARPAWDASFAELWEQRQEGAAGAARWVDGERIASWAARGAGVFISWLWPRPAPRQ